MQSELMVLYIDKIRIEYIQQEKESINSNYTADHLPHQQCISKYHRHVALNHQTSIYRTNYCRWNLCVCGEGKEGVIFWVSLALAKGRRFSDHLASVIFDISGDHYHHFSSHFPMHLSNPGEVERNFSS